MSQKIFVLAPMPSLVAVCGEPSGRLTTSPTALATTQKPHIASIVWCFAFPFASWRGFALYLSLDLSKHMPRP